VKFPQSRGTDRAPIFLASDAAGFVTGHLLAGLGAFRRAASVNSVNHARRFRSAKRVSEAVSGSEINVEITACTFFELRNGYQRTRMLLQPLLHSVECDALSGVCKW
jgi:hypothetical protein